MQSRESDTQNEKSNEKQLANGIMDRLSTEKGNKRNSNEERIHDEENEV